MSYDEPLPQEYCPLLVASASAHTRSASAAARGDARGVALRRRAGGAGRAAAAGAAVHRLGAFERADACGSRPTARAGFGAAHRPSDAFSKRALPCFVARPGDRLPPRFGERCGKLEVTQRPLRLPREMRPTPHVHAAGRAVQGDSLRMNALEQELKQLLIEVLNLEDITVEQIDSEAPLFGDGLGPGFDRRARARRRDSPQVRRAHGRGCRKPCASTSRRSRTSRASSSGTGERRLGCARRARPAKATRARKLRTGLSLAVARRARALSAARSYFSQSRLGATWMALGVIAICGVRLVALRFSVRRARGALGAASCS